MVTIGPHIKINVPRDLRKETTAFFIEALDCRLVHSERPDVEFFRFENGATLGVYFCPPAEALDRNEMKKAAWLELRVPDPAKMKERLLTFGVEAVPYFDQTRFHFQAPGGQVFRLAGESDGL